MSIVFAARDAAGAITGLFARPQPSFDVFEIDDGDAEVAAFKASIAPKPTLTFLQFMALFTPAEQAAIINSTDTQTRLFVMMATGSGSLSLNNPEVVAGVNYLATPSTATPPGPGILAAGRFAQILAGQAPAG
jgi:hypothetical protein